MERKLAWATRPVERQARDFICPDMKQINKLFTLLIVDVLYKHVWAGFITTSVLQTKYSSVLGG